MNHHQQQFHPTMMPPFAQPPHADQGDDVPSTPPSSSQQQQHLANRPNGKPSKHHLEELRKRKRDLEKKFQHRSPTQVDSFPTFQTSCSSLDANGDDDQHDAVTPKKPLPPAQMAEWWSSSSSSSSEHSRSVSSSTSLADPAQASERKPKSRDKASSYSSQPVLWDDQESVASKLKLLWR